MQRCFSPWIETVLWVLAEFFYANVILSKVIPVTISGTVTTTAAQLCWGTCHKWGERGKRFCWTI